MNTDPPADIVARLSRAEISRLVAMITRWLGADRIDLAKDAVQDALAAALRTWPLSGVPANPSAWLHQVARRKALDEIRRQAPEPLTDAHAAIAAEPPPASLPLDDPDLALVLLCSHPSLSSASAAILTLKVAAGFSVPEIARLFLADPRAVEQRLVRAKQRLRDAGPDLDIRPEDLERRTLVALDVIYAMFVEGYASLSAPSGLRRELCAEALRLVELVTMADAGAIRPAAHALAALFSFQSSRLDARFDPAGSLVRLRDQDRTSWDRALIGRARSHLRNAATGERLSRYHVEAEIASCHADAARFEDTDWARIRELYRLLDERWPSPVVTLNRAIVEAEVRGPAAGLELLDRVDGPLAGYYPYHAARAELLRDRGDTGLALGHFRRAVALAAAGPVKEFLTRRLDELSSADVDSAGPHPS